MKKISFLIIVLLTLFCAKADAGLLTLLSEIDTPLAFPALGLDFDETNNSLWGIENTTSDSPIINFDLDGSIIQQFKTVPAFNNQGVATNNKVGSDKRIYYWQNISRTLYETRTDGSIVSSIQVNPAGPIVGASSLDFDPLTGNIILTNNFRPLDRSFFGFNVIKPGTGLVDIINYDFGAELGFDNVGGFSVTEDEFWILGSKLIGNSYTKVVRLDRLTFGKIDEYDLLTEELERYRGLALDLRNSTLYVNRLNSDNEDVTLRAYEFSAGQPGSSVIPEPSTILLFSTGILGAWVRKRRS